MRIYISGPITNTKDFKERFQKAVKFLISEYPNATIINPSAMESIFITKQKISHEEYMELSFKLMNKCDCIYLLKGWQASTGCNQEYGYAMAKNMIRLYEKS